MDGDDNRIQDFIFLRELAEVYLLLDHVSASSNKSFDANASNVVAANVAAATAAANAAAAAVAAGGPGLAAAARVAPPTFPAALANIIPPGVSPGMAAWILEVCKVSWPPTGGEIEEDAQAATLIMAKDFLNRLAAPATGFTIAFTLLVAGEDGDAEASPLERGAEWLRQRTGRTARRAPREEGGAPTPRPTRGSLNWGKVAPSRTSLAELSYRGLDKSARRFRNGVVGLVAALGVILVLTCMLSWNVAVGNGLETHLTELQKQRPEIDKLIADADKAAPAPAPALTGSAAAAAATPTDRAAAAVASSAGHFVRYCERVTREPVPGRPNETRDVFESAVQQQVCDRDRDYRQDQAVTEANLAEWLDGWETFWPLADVPRPPGSAQRPYPNLQWAAVYLGVLGGGVLPICYGFLGAGAAVTRKLSSSMRESLLSPRDLTLAFIQLALGAVIGACVGLFAAAPPGPPAGAGLLSAVPLSASALCFIAGFGVEQVFVALQALMTRVFGSTDPTKPK